MTITLGTEVPDPGDRVAFDLSEGRPHAPGAGRMRDAFEPSEDTLILVGPGTCGIDTRDPTARAVRDLRHGGAVGGDGRSGARKRDIDPDATLLA